MSCSFVDFFRNANVKSIIHDSEHRIYLGTVGATWIAHPDGHMTELTINEGLPQKTAQAIFLDKQGRCWLGTWGGGVVMLTKDWQVCKALAFPDATHVGSIAQDASGNLWVGSLTSGLWCLPARQSSWTSATVPHGMNDIRVVRAIPKSIAQQLLAMANHS